MRVIVRQRLHKAVDNIGTVNVFIPDKSTKYVDALRELWEREYNSWSIDPDRELSWFEEDHARIENDYYLTEFFITNVAEVKT